MIKPNDKNTDRGAATSVVAAAIARHARPRCDGVGVASADQCSCQAGYLLHTANASVEP